MVFCHAHLNEDTTSSTRVFLKYLFSELANSLGNDTLNKYVNDPMKQLRMLLLTIFVVTLPSVTIAQYGNCVARNGRSGECISTSRCSSLGGTSDPANLCPGDQTIQCCTYRDCKNSQGVAGSCQPTATCAGKSDPANLCPGGNNIQCCTGGSSSGGNLPYLNAKQSTYARIIGKAARDNGLPRRACEVAIVTAIVESNIRVYANSKVAESYKYPHDAVGSDHDSVGIFQQRPQFWGTVKDCMDPKTSANKFYNALKGVAGWQSVSVGTAAQKVQRSAYPLRYDEHTTKATAICNIAY
ncbi:unnamed protein product [Adineta steineri]|uniref:Uncharacterized protein n=2 Tax=Adineta steineri TaxID=433720 RepID=A0A814U1D0_9BILA|nr:unnamed protein product [Adineta steineri]CAF1170118.1 unnamed protein product [Adineta steineri]